MGRRRVYALAVASLTLASGCNVDRYDRRAGLAADRVLDDELAAMQSARAQSVVRPEVVPVPQVDTTGAPTGVESGPADLGAAPEGVDPAAAADVQVLTVQDAVRVAIRGNRRYKGQVESLHLQASSLVGTRHSFSPLLSASLSYAFSDGDGVNPSHSATLSGGLSQILRYGGSASISGSSSWSETQSDNLDGDVTNSVSVGLSQPLLQGFGEEITMEPLVQAERSMLYALRSFELFREDFSIDVAERYYALVEQKKQIDNSRSNLDSLAFSRRKAEAFFEVGRGTELDALRARRSELQAQDSLNASIESFELAMDGFKIFLGLETDAQIDVVDEVPIFVPFRFDLESSLDVAMKNRLDVITEYDQLEDAKRGLRISENALLPSLDLSLSWGAAVEGESSLDTIGLGPDSYSASLSLDLPVDLVSEQISVHSARISYAQTLRSHEEFIDNVEIGIRNAFRGLVRQVQSIDIQRELVVDLARSVRKAEIEFEKGAISNRDLVEAEEQLLDAENQLISEQVAYEIARLRLLRDLGILFIDQESGMWIE